MQGQRAVLFVVFFLALGGLAQEKKQTLPSGWKVPLKDAQRQNPVKSTADSIAAGKRIYGYDCAMCHGKAGDGKGDLADSMKLSLRDYREPDALKDFNDGELFYIITSGRGDMPGEGDRLKPQECWNVVNYVRSLAKKEPPAKPKEENPPN